MIDIPTQKQLYDQAIDYAISGGITLEVSASYGPNISAAHIREFQETLPHLDFVGAHPCYHPGDLIRTYKIPEAYSILRVNQVMESPLVAFVASSEPGLVRCVLE